MNRRNFFRNGSLFALGAAMPLGITARDRRVGLYPGNKAGEKAKNIIFMVSDGMSAGTLSMADQYLFRKTGKGSAWVELYREGRVSRALMDTSSASSIVTDSAAAGSSWGCGYRVNNGSLNTGANGESYLPIWQKFRKKGKKAGCVTTVPITHATPASFCIANKSRGAQAEIAGQYLALDFDVLMGGGAEYFDAERRKDKKDLFSAFRSKGYQVVRNRTEMLKAGDNEPVLGVFYENGLPYSIDRNHDKDLEYNIPTLAEMTRKAIDVMKSGEEGFVLQVEGGKVDWAAHANDVAGLIYDQVAFDEAVKTAVDFAEEDGDTLVIITTDHGNANPGIISGSKASDNFDSITGFRHSNDWILNGISRNSTVSQVRERIAYANGGGTLSVENARKLLDYYNDLETEEGLYNPKHLPFRQLAEMQRDFTSVGWMSMDHSADYVEVAMLGPGSELLPSFVKNTDLHYLMLEAAEVENAF